LYELRKIRVSHAALVASVVGVSEIARSSLASVSDLSSDLANRDGRLEDFARSLPIVGRLQINPGLIVMLLRDCVSIWMTLVGLLQMLLFLLSSCLRQLI
jgi:hypothetical protein